MKSSFHIFVRLFAFFSGFIILVFAVVLALAPEKLLSLFADDDVDLSMLSAMSGGTITLLINTCYTFMIAVGAILVTLAFKKGTVCNKTQVIQTKSCNIMIVC